MDLQELLDLARKAEADGRTADRDRLMDMYFKSEAEASASAINVPEGSTLLKQYPDGGYITQNRKTRQMNYVNPNDAYVTADQGTITSIMREGGDAAKVVKGEMSRDVVGEGLTAIASGVGGGIPALRG